MNGLAAVIENAGSLHGIAEPPAREDYSTEAEYKAAHRDWWQRVNFWDASRTDTCDGMLTLTRDAGGRPGP